MPAVDTKSRPRRLNTTPIAARISPAQAAESAPARHPRRTREKNDNGIGESPETSLKPSRSEPPTKQPPDADIGVTATGAGATKRGGPFTNGSQPLEPNAEPKRLPRTGTEPGAETKRPPTRSRRILLDDFSEEEESDLHT